MNKYDDTDYLIEREDSIEYEESENKEEKWTIGEIIDNLMENPAIVIRQLTKMCEECNKVNEELQIKLKNKQSEIDFLKGKIAVYEKFLNLEDLNNE